MTRYSDDNVYSTLDRLGSDDIVVRQDRCIQVRNRNATCTLCADACASGCIAYVDRRLSVDAGKCIGCGTCATVCPTCALEARNPDDAELLARCKRTADESAGSRLCVACDCADFSAIEGADALGEPVRVPCLGRIEESLILELAVRGAKEIDLVAGGCATCEHASGRAVCDEVCATANALLQAWGNPLRLGVREVAFVAKTRTEKDVVEPDRPAAKPRYLKVMPDGTLPHFVPDRRERLLDALAELGDPIDAVLETRLTGHVEIDLDACTSCRLCATFCPTGAIAKFDDEDGTFGLVHTPGDCVKCRCCEKVCRAGAIQVAEGVHARDLLDCAPQRIELQPVGLHKGNRDSMRDALRVLLGMEEIFDR